jgi:chaperone required for assembly of F1-ATPase
MRRKPEPADLADPIARARRAGAPAGPKRFYAQADMREEAGLYALRLDGKEALTPARNRLRVPQKTLAAEIAAEWRQQGERIDPASMPATRLANSAIDGVAPRMAEARRDILAYADSDLLCYRAGEPEGLVLRQRQAWDPLVGWAERRFCIRIVLAEGVVHAPQPTPTLAALARAVAAYDEPFRLAGLSLATTLTGSLILALALAEGEVDAETAWRAAHVDEDWNIEKWGEDAEAAQRRAARFADFRAAALALAAEER